MDEKKKAIIAIGAGVAALGGILLLRGKKKPPPRYICPDCGETFASEAELMAHIQAEHPDTPPTQYGRILGYIRDEESGSKIADAKVYMDGLLDTTSDSNGAYSTNYVAFGNHTLKVEADNYQTNTIEVEISLESKQMDILLAKLPVLPTGWTEGVTIREIEVTPAIIYLGGAVDITVYVDYPTPVPESLHGTILVDSVELTGDFATTYARCEFHYTPTAVGEYTVFAQDKSAHFTVLQDVVATYYSPFGGRRMPVCTQFTVPNVPPFEKLNVYFPGGDYILTAGCGFFYTVPDQVVPYLNGAYPSAWQPSNSNVTSWLKEVHTTTHTSLLVTAVDYTCQEYWNSKEELARMIVGMCGITGWYTWPGLVSNCFQGSCQYWITCPFCGRFQSGWVRPGWTSSEKIAFARNFLAHMEERHPTHPLTQPAWF